MSTLSSHTAQPLLDELQSLEKDQAQRLLTRLMPIVSSKYYKDINHELLKLMHDDEVTREAIVRTPAELFDIACKCVGMVTGVKDVAHRLDKKADVVLSRYYVMFVMLEEMHRFAFITYGKVGSMFDKKLNHASVIHARHMLQSYLESDEMVRQEMEAIARLLTKHGHWRTLEALERVVPLKSKHITL
jgi:chromosomal replication initiation ATPase DnaA